MKTLLHFFIACFLGAAVAGSSTLFAADPTGTGLTGYYYPNDSLIGAPTITRTDPSVAFNWGTGSPASTIPIDHFSVRWMGYIQPLSTEDVTLIVRADDGARVWIDGQLVINQWVSQSATDATAVIHADVSRKAFIVIEYFENTGFSEASLLWQSATIPRQVIPTTNLFPMPGVVTTLATTSPVSPAFIEGRTVPGHAPHVSASGSTSTTVMLDDTTFYANVALSEQGSTVTVTSDGTTISGTMVWSATTIASSQTASIRVNDSLRLASPVTGKIRVYNACGVLGKTITASAGVPVVQKFTLPGLYSVVAEDSTGGEVATMPINVVGASLNGPIACEVGFTRGKNVSLSDSTVASVTSLRDDVLQISSITSVDVGQQRLGLTCIGYAKTALVARLTSGTKAIIQSVPIDIFSLDVKARSEIVVNADTSAGNDQLTMRPYVPGISFTLTMNAHHSTFSGGAWTLAFNSSQFQVFTDPVDHVKKGLINYEIEMPADEDAYCYRLSVAQGVDDMESVNDQQINGTDCRLKVDQIFFVQGTDAVKVLPVTCVHKGSRHHPHPIMVVPNGASPTIDSGSPIDCPGDGLPIAPPVKVKNTAGVPANKFAVDIDTTKFPDVIIVWDLELDTNGNARVTANQTLNITAVPEMPIMRAKLIPAGLPGTATWLDSFLYARFDPNPSNYAPNPNPYPAANVWDINQTMGNDFRGGNITLSVTYMGDLKKLPYIIHGINATQAVAQAFLVSLNPPPYASSIIQKESTTSGGSWQQFNAGARSNNGEPNFGAPDGWGLGQLEQLPRPAGAQDLWNWKQNLTDAASKMIAFQAQADAFIAGQVAQQVAQDPGKPLANESFTFGGVTYKSGTTRTPEQACGIKLYNGAAHNAVAWNRPESPGVWSKNDDTGYVSAISAIWGQ